MLEQVRHLKFRESLLGKNVGGPEQALVDGEGVSTRDTQLPGETLERNLNSLLGSFSLTYS